MERYQRDGRVAVLISPGFGAGWSTWNQDHPDIMFDPQIVDLVLNYHGDDVGQRIKAICEIKYPGCYTGGMDDLTVIWLDLGERFVINEYDGSESITREKDMLWTIA